eukprot:13831310-Heterocapsa_arctica.AAC.2
MEAQKRKRPRQELEHPGRWPRATRAWWHSKEKQGDEEEPVAGWKDHHWGKELSKPQWKDAGNWADNEEEEDPAPWVETLTYDEEGKLMTDQGKSSGSGG